MRVRARRRGFSLIELMAVVVIVGVLSVLAVVGYRKWFGSTRLSEATHMVNEIRAAQERRKAETGQYLDVSLTVDVPNMYPQATPTNVVTQWGKKCSVCQAGVDWSDLTVSANEPVMFGYATRAGDETCAPTCRGVAPTINGTIVDFVGRNGGAITKPWFVAVAKGDTNANGVFATVVGDSFANNLLIDKEGE